MLRKTYNLIARLLINIYVVNGIEVCASGVCKVFVILQNCKSRESPVDASLMLHCKTGAWKLKREKRGKFSCAYMQLVQG